MTSSKFPDLPPTPYDPLPTYPQPPQQPQYILLLPHYYRNPHQLLCRSFRRYIYCAAVVIILVTALFFLWPSDPELSVSRVHLRHFKIHSFPKIAIDVTLDVTVKIRNRDFYSVNFRSVLISIGYRGKQLGYVISDYGRIKARASSYINATLELTDVSVFSDIIPLIEDLARGSITFDTVTQIGGELGLVLFDIPIKGKVSCEIVVDTRNETISHQNCYPEV
ncbi:hypothetical protein RND71_017185 [Anisodus tanguticus]|uniref:Late embryogenesis abundant protein LEA-2 subgroup domain-containing protein n=1 Tax=Anisodus tanguticus TaxID=243964 RepID=A0AAE1VI01_9SOLA|nr:hypothetical protein RND71_017185 [Anisodus tanguticus]